MNKTLTTQQDLNKAETVKFIMDFTHRLVMHHAMWYTRVKDEIGQEKTNKILHAVLDRSYEIQLNRLAKTLDFEMKDGLPTPLLNLPDEVLKALKETIAINWLANDGVWFQAVEFSEGMEIAKKCNDACWGHFSPFEAWSIKQFLNLPENPGLEGLKQALQFRLYATINKQSITDETTTGFIFRMNECRVQSARKRKGLDDYPCKSGGLIEYATFASAIDSRIKTECIGCPPDQHPEEWYCAWRFYTESF
jgi:hypothetical protein